MLISSMCANEPLTLAALAGDPGDGAVHLVLHILDRLGQLLVGHDLQELLRTPRQFISSRHSAAVASSTFSTDAGCASLCAPLCCMHMAETAVDLRDAEQPRDLQANDCNVADCRRRHNLVSSSPRVTCLRGADRGTKHDTHKSGSSSAPAC